VKFLPLVWAGIWRKPGRTILTMLSIVTAFLLFGLLQGLLSGLGTTIADTHADVLITQSRVSQLEPLPLSQMAQIARVPGVRAVAPIVVFHGSYHSSAVVNVRAYAVDPDAIAAANPDESIPPALIAKLKATRTGVLVPATVAAQFGLKLGDRMPLKTIFWTNRDGSAVWPLDVVGIYRSNPKDVLLGTSLLANYDYLDQGRRTGAGTVTVFLVRVSDPGRAGVVARGIDALFANSPNETKTTSERQLLADSIKQIGDIGFVIRAIVGAAFFALLFSVAAVMMQQVRERTPELAVLKTLGFSDPGVLALILAEALVFCIASAAIGLALADLIFPAVRLLGLTVAVGQVTGIGLVFAVLLAIVAGLPPAIRGMRLSIVDALAGR
jgi:putative ABC transport system permease protein